MLKVQTGEKIKKRSGKTVKTYAPLSRQDVAGWLACGVDNVSSIESGRVKLTGENAQIIMQQTHISLKWLCAGDPSNPIHFTGRPYEQKHFDEAQRQMKDPSLPALKAQRELANGVGLISTILLRAVQLNEFELYASKLRNTLRDIFQRFPKTQAYVDLSRSIDMAGGTSLGDGESQRMMKPMLDEWDSQLLRVVDFNRRRAKGRH